MRLRYRQSLLSLGLLCVCLGCEEPTTSSEQITGGRRGMTVRLDYGRLDRSVRRMDMRVQSTKDMGVVDAARPIPSEYVPYGQCPEMISFLGQVTGDGAAVPNGGHPLFEPFYRT